MTLQADLEQGVADIKEDTAKLKAIVNGPASGVESMVSVGDGDQVKTAQRAIAEIGDLSSQATKNLDNVSDVDFAAKAVTAGVGAGDVLAANNLSDITDPAAARTNLGTYAKAEVDAAISAATSGLTSVDQAARDHNVLQDFELWRINGLSAGAMANTYTDVFADLTGVSIDAEVVIDQATGTNIGNMTASDGLAGAFDGDNNTRALNNAASGSEIGKTYSSARTISRIDFRTYHAAKIDGGVGTETITVEVRGSTDGFAASDELIEAFAGLTNDQNGQLFSLVLASAASYSSFKLVFSHTGGAETNIAEVIFHEQSSSGDSTNAVYNVGGDYFSPSSGTNMVLASVTITADADPDSLRAFFDIEEMEAATENTDYIGAVSRDGGVNWSTLTLARVDGGVAGRGSYAGTADMSGQPAGSGIRIRLSSANTKNIRVHRWGLQADQVLTLV